MFDANILGEKSLMLCIAGIDMDVLYQSNTKC